MKVISAAEFEQNFDAIIEDVAENHTHYKILLEEDNSAVMLVPYQEYDCLLETYQDWLNNSAADAEETY